MVRVGPDGSASVVINAATGVVVSNSVGDSGAARTQRSRKFRKEVMGRSGSAGRAETAVLYT